MTSDKVAVVVSTARESRIRDFLDAWSAELGDSHVIVVEDNPGPTFTLHAPGTTHYTWCDVDARLGLSSWIIPRRTSCIRSFGYFMAALRRPEMIVSLSEDCRPDPEHPEFLAGHRDRLHGGWLAGAGKGKREAPAAGRPVVLSQGWCGPGVATAGAPPGGVLPLCPRNMAFRPEAAPALYFLLMGREYECDRLGNDWSGILLSRIAGHLGLAVSRSGPGVLYFPGRRLPESRRRDPVSPDAVETFRQAVGQVGLTGTSVVECYAEMAEKLPLTGDYWMNLRQAMRVWAGLFDGRESVRAGSTAGEMVTAA